jgi:hypothetical protein
VRRDRFAFRGPERLEQRCVLSAPPLLAGIQVQNGAAALNVDSPGYSAPTMADWDGDGKKDLIVGQFTGGNVWLYLNKGTDASPVFNGGTKVLCGGVPLTTSYG